MQQARLAACVQSSLCCAPARRPARCCSRAALDAGRWRTE